MFTVEVWSCLEAEEELGTIRVRTRVRHGKDTPTCVLMDEILVRELVSIDTFTPSAVSSGEIAALGHEAVDNSVE